MEQKEPTSKLREEWETLSFRPIPLQWCLGLPSIRRMPTSVSTTVESSGGKVVKSTRLLPMWPGFDFQTRRHMWGEVFGSLLCTERFFPGYSGFSPGTLVFLRVLRFFPGTPVFLRVIRFFSGYSGFSRVLRFSPGTPVFLRVLQFSPGTPVFPQVLRFFPGTLVFPPLHKPTLD